VWLDEKEWLVVDLKHDLVLGGMVEHQVNRLARVVDELHGHIKFLR
jgi:hypothetical protein